MFQFKTLYNPNTILYYEQTFSFHSEASLLLLCQSNSPTGPRKRRLRAQSVSDTFQIPGVRLF